MKSIGTILAFAIALALSACGGPRFDAVPVVDSLPCLVEPPPELYELPERQTESIRPDEYTAERDVLEGRHTGFKGAWQSYTADWHRYCEPNLPGADPE